MYIIHSQKPTVIKLPIYHAGVAMVQGALVMPGTTEATNDGVYIVASSTGADAIGVLNQAIATTDTDCDPTGATSDYGLFEVDLYRPGDLLYIPYDMDPTTLVVDGTAAAASSTMTIGSIEDPLGQGWMYVCTGTGAGQLHLVESSNGSALTLVTALTTACAGTDACVKILPVAHQLGLLTTAADEMGSEEAAGTWTIHVLENYIERAGKVELLRPDKHDGLDGLNASSVELKFYCKAFLRNCAAATTE